MTIVNYDFLLLILGEENIQFDVTLEIQDDETIAKEIQLALDHELALSLLTD